MRNDECGVSSSYLSLNTIKPSIHHSAFIIPHSSLVATGARSDPFFVRLGLNTVLYCSGTAGPFRGFLKGPASREVNASYRGGKATHLGR